MKFAAKLCYLLVVTGASAFTLPGRHHVTAFPSALPTRATQAETSRSDFVASVTASVLGLSFLSFWPLSQPAVARGRATLEQAYDRYTPRIIAGGKFYSSDLRKMIEKNDWAAIKAATSDPPKKSKEDRTKADGGIAERAAQAGGFSEARVAVACDLFAAAFSDNSISSKTKKMQKEADGIREVIVGINGAAREALGEESGGGLFGFGAKKANPAELSKRVRQLYQVGGNSYNQYVFAANDELPISLAKLPYLK